MPAIGGGICQLTNALYEAALCAGFDIVERHPHTMKIPGPQAHRPDATVAWNHIDLRIRPKSDAVLRVTLTRDELIVQILGNVQARRLVLPVFEDRGRAPNSCVTCGQEDCHKHATPAQSSGITAVLVDRVWPEYSAYLDTATHEKDILLAPVDPRLVSRQAYQWDASKFAAIHTATIATLLRAWQSRRLADEGPERRRAALAADAALARRYAMALGTDVTHLVVYQQFLPFLWRDGCLGGRSYDVMMTRLPLLELHGVLDEAARQHPAMKSLADFRAETWMVDAESQALNEAHRIITPHSKTATLFRDKATLLPWSYPAAISTERGRAIAFPGPAIARKGSSCVREVARRVGMPVRIVGRDLEPAGFWDGIEMDRPATGHHWLAGVSCVLQPAIVEDQPRKLLEAIACNVPVIATPACGLQPAEGLTLVEAGDVDAMVMAVQASQHLQYSTENLGPKSRHEILG